MTMILIDGFDHADYADVWTASALALDTGTIRTGTRSGNQVGAGGPLYGEAYYALSASDVDDGVTMGMAFWLASADANSGFFLGARSSGMYFSEDSTVHLSANFRNDTRAIELWRGPVGTGTRLGFTDTNIFTFNTWNYLELGAKIADSGGLAEIRLNGVPVLDYAGDTRNAGTAGTINRMGFTGGGDTGSAQNRRFDDAYLLNEQGSAPYNSFLGDLRMYPRLPNGNGFYSQLLGSDGNSTNNSLLVDEVGAPLSADYVGSATNGEIDTYAFEDMSAVQSIGTIYAVESRIYAAKTETGTKQMRLIVRRSSTDATGPDHILAENSYATYRYIMQLDPHAGPGAWTISNFDATEFGVEVRP